MMYTYRTVCDVFLDTFSKFSTNGTFFHYFDVPFIESISTQVDMHESNYK